LGDKKKNIKKRMEKFDIGDMWGGKRGTERYIEEKWKE
jgi:hypothetical protein